MTRRPGTPPFWRRRSPSPGPVVDCIRSRPTPSPPTLHLSRWASSDRRFRIPTFCQTPGAGKSCLLRSPFARRSASPPPSYEDFERSRSNRPQPLPEPRSCASDLEPTLTTSTTATQTDPVAMPITAIKHAVAEAVGVSLPPVMRANQRRFDHLLDELLKLKT